MARNKYPEKTVEKILEAAEKLFIEKGYTNTSMQDIIDALSPVMTKGAIYHHFKSKVFIYEAIVNARFDGMIKIYDEVAARTDLNGAQKLKLVNSLGVTSEQYNTILSFMAHVNKESDSFDPAIGAFVIRLAENKFIPVYEKIAREGIEDGTINVESSQILAESLVYMLFVWMMCRLTAVTPKEYRKRMKFVETMFGAYGIELIDPESKKKYIERIEREYN